MQEPLDKAKDAAKARKAAADPKRPGEKCHADAGRYVPVVERARCEGKKDCDAVCPYNVFEVRRIEDADFAALSFFAKLKSRCGRRDGAGGGSGVTVRAKSREYS